MNPKALFDNLRVSFGSLSASQVAGINTILPVCQQAQLTSSQAAYILATAYHETAYTLQPIEEYGKGRGHSYGLPAGPWHQVYDGRGYVQLTWYNNYLKANTRLHAMGVLKASEDLTKNPQLALRPDISALVLVYGMKEGWFTGKKLSDYSDYVSMRHIVNGTDRAALIAKYAYSFEAALKAGGYSPALIKPIIIKEVTPVSEDFKNIVGGIIRAQAPTLVAYLVSKHILPPGDYTDLIVWGVGLLMSVWSVHTNLTNKPAPTA